MTQPKTKPPVPVNILAVHEAIIRELSLLPSDRTLKLYMLDTLHIIEQFKKLSNMPILNTFNVSRRDKLQNDRMYAHAALYDHYTAQARKYTDSVIPRRVADMGDVGGGGGCPACGSNDSQPEDEFGSVVTCLACFATLKIISTSASCSDADRISISTRHVQDRRSQMKDYICQYQGKQCVEIPDMVYERLRDHLRLRGCTDPNAENVYHAVSKDHIRKAMHDLALTRYYDHALLVYRNITGKHLDDVSQIECRILSDFDILLSIMHREGRKPKRLVSIPELFLRITNRIKQRMNEPLTIDFLF